MTTPSGWVGERALTLAADTLEQYREVEDIFLPVAVGVFVAFSGLILGAWYLMTMLRRLLFGAVKEPDHHGEMIEDLKPREWLMLTPIAVLCVLLGVYPKPVLDSVKPDLEMVVRMTDGARQRAAAPPPAPGVARADRP